MALVTGAGLIIVAITFILILFSEHFSAYIPFSAEKKLAAYYKTTPPAKNEQDTLHYLNQLSQRIIAQTSQLPAGMTITTHYVNDDTVNAFATLGGNIVLFRGLLEKMPNENALAMVIAHEIAHIKLRHPIKVAGRSVAFAAAMTMLGQASGSQLAGQMFNQAGILTVLKFTRAQEEAADRAALTALNQLYGHTEGVNAVFDLFQTQEENTLNPEFFRSHPYSENRSQAMREIANDNHWLQTGNITTLPSPFLPKK